MARQVQQVWARLNWPHVALFAIMVGGALGALAILLRGTPPELLEKLVTLNWGAVALGALSFLIAAVGMLRRAGILHPAEPDASSLEPRRVVSSSARHFDDDGSLDDDELERDEPTGRQSPVSKARAEDPPGDRSRARRRGEASVRLLAMSVGVLSAVALVGWLLSGCGSTGPQFATTTPVTSVAITIHAIDGGQVHHVDLWVDGTSAEAKPITTGTTQDIDSEVGLNASTAVALPGATASSTQAVEERTPAPADATRRTAPADASSLQEGDASRSAAPDASHVDERHVDEDAPEDD